MSDRNRIVWSEGLFLKPQHFQQQDRYLEAFVEGRVSGLHSNPWGFTALELDEGQLTAGKVVIRSAQGVFPDGTPFSIPGNDAPPPPLDVAAMRDQVISLALPLRQAGATLVDRGSSAKSYFRYRAGEAETRDVSTEAGAGATLDTASLNLRLVAGSASQEDLTTIPLAHVIECRADRNVMLQSLFIPSVLYVNAGPQLASYLSEVQGLLFQRAEALALRAVGTSRGGTAEIIEFIMLQIVNRFDPLITHLNLNGTCHPEVLYQYLLQLVGELSTVATATRRPPKFPAYQHHRLRESFEPVINTLRDCLSLDTGRNVVEIPLQLGNYDTRRGVIADKTLLDDAVFVLAVRAEIADEELRRLFPQQCKIGPVEQIGELVNLSLPGIRIRALPAAPRQLHNIAGSHYFEMERGSSLWKTLKASGGLAIHVSGNYPGLALECWAIRG